MNKETTTEQKQQVKVFENIFKTRSASCPNCGGVHIHRDGCKNKVVEE